MSAGTILNARQAIGRHIQWKITLQLAIQMQEPLSADAVDQIRYHRNCAIGRWLESPSTAAMRTNAAYYDLVKKHQDFHREMGCIAKLIADQQFSQAALAIQLGSAFDLSSKALALAITSYDVVSPMSISA